MSDYNSNPENKTGIKTEQEIQLIDQIYKKYHRHQMNIYPVAL